MPRKLQNVKRGAGSIQSSVIEDTALRYSKRDIDPLKVHIHDPNKAHMASTIGIIDSGDYYSSDEVEGALQEIGAGGSATRSNGLTEGGTYTSAFPSITLDTPSKAYINGIERDISGLTIDIGSLPNGNYFVYVETDNTDPNYLQLVATTTQPLLSDEKVLIAFICHNGASFVYEQDARFFVTDLDRKVQYTVRQGEDKDAWSEGCFATLEAAFFYLSKFHDQGAGVTDDYRSTLLVRGNHVINRPLELNNGYLNTTGIYSLIIKGDGQNSITTSGSFTGSYMINANVATDDVNYPSPGIVLEDLVFKNSGGVVLTALVRLNCEQIYINRCKVRESTDIFLTGIGTFNVSNCDIECSQVAFIDTIYTTTRLHFSNTLMQGDQTAPAFVCNALTVQNCRVYNFTVMAVQHIGNCVVSGSEINCKSLIDGNGNVHGALTHFIGNKIYQPGTGTAQNEALIKNYGRIGEFLFNNNICERSASFNNDWDVWVHTTGFDTITMTDNVFINYQLLKVVGDTLESSFHFRGNTCKSVSLEVESTGIINVSDNLLSSEGATATNFPKLKVTNSDPYYNCTVENNTIICNSSVVNIVELTGTMSLTFKGNSLHGGATTLLTNLYKVSFQDNLFDGKGNSNVYYNVDSLVTIVDGILLSFIDNVFQHGYGGIKTNKASDLIIKDNLFSQLGVGPTPLYVIEIETTTITNTIIANNTFSSCGDVGLPGATSTQISLIAVYATGTANALNIKENIVENTSPTFGGTNLTLDIAVDTLTDSVVSNNFIRNYTFPTVGGDIFSIACNQLTRTNIDDNKIGEDLTFGYDLGIHIQSLVVTDVSVSRNSIKAYNQNAIFFDPIITTSACSYTRVVVADNILTNTTTAVIDSTRLGCIRFGFEYTDTNCFVNDVFVTGNTIIGPNVGIMFEMTDQSAVFGGDLNNIVIRNNRYKDSSTDASLYRSGISLYHTVTDLVANFQFEEIVISDNLLDLNNAHDNGIHVYSQYIDMERLQINNNLINGTVNAIHLQAPTTVSSWKFVSVNGNTIEQRSSTANASGIKLVSATVQWQKVTISDNHIDTTGLNTYTATPLSINLVQSGDVVKDFLITNNVFKGLGGATSVVASRCDLYIINGYVEGFTFQGNTVEAERGLDIQWTHAGVSQRLDVSNNNFKGRHGIVFRPSGTGYFSNCKFDGNLLDVDTVSNKDTTYIFGFVLDLNDIGFNTSSINNNSIRGHSNLGGIYVSHDSLGRVSIDGNTHFVQDGEVPFIYVVGNQDGAAIQDTSISKNVANGYLLEGWSGTSLDAVILLEYTSVGTGYLYKNIKIEDNQLSNIASDNHVILVMGKGTGTQEFEGISGLSVSGNEIINLSCSSAIFLSFLKCVDQVTNIMCKNNVIGKDTSNTSYGIFFVCPTPTGSSTIKVSDIQIDGNNVTHTATGGHYGIYLTSDHDYDTGERYTLQNVSVNNNSVYTIVDSELAKGIYCLLNTNVNGLSVDGNKVSSQTTATYPANGILISHTLTTGAEFVQPPGSNGNDFTIYSLTGQAYIAGYTSAAFPDLQVTPNGGAPFSDVGLYTWVNISVSNNNISYKSLFKEYPVSGNPATTPNERLRYPIHKNADLFVCPVHYSGLSNGITSNRKLVVMPVYGLTISNNTLRGLETTTPLCGLVIHTCPVYARWNSDDPNGNTGGVGDPQYKYIAQNWNISNNNSSGYTVYEHNTGTNFYQRGMDTYYLAALRSTVDLTTELNYTGITTGNVAQVSGLQSSVSSAVPSGTWNATTPGTSFTLQFKWLDISTSALNQENPDAAKMRT